MSQTEMDSLLARLSHDLADLVETQVASLSPDARKLIAAAVERGGCLAVSVMLNPWPNFITVLVGEGAEPVELFQIQPSREALTPHAEQGH